jgi:hypothetical protein
VAQETAIYVKWKFFKRANKLLFEFTQTFWTIHAIVTSGSLTLNDQSQRRVLMVPASATPPCWAKFLFELCGIHIQKAPDHFLVMGMALPRRMFKKFDTGPA